MAQSLRLLSAGAAQGLANALAPRLRAIAGAELRGVFAPVGAVRERLLAGETCDVVVSTPAMLEELARNGRVDAASIANIGRVHAGIAARVGDCVPTIDTGDALASALDAAPRIFLPDPVRATAGGHFMKVLRELGLHEELAPRLSSHPNGAAAMAALASALAGCLGCTQITEIRDAEGVTLVGALPAPFDLVTTYAAAVCASAGDSDLARCFVGMLTGADSSALRTSAGFEM